MIEIRKRRSRRFLSQPLERNDRWKLKCPGVTFKAPSVVIPDGGTEKSLHPEGERRYSTKSGRNYWSSNSAQLGSERRPILGWIDGKFVWSDPFNARDETLEGNRDSFPRNAEGEGTLSGLGKESSAVLIKTALENGGQTP